MDIAAIWQVISLILTFEINNFWKKKITQRLDESSATFMNWFTDAPLKPISKDPKLEVKDYTFTLTLLPMYPQVSEERLQKLYGAQSPQ